MDSRMNKYGENTRSSRYQKNEDLYKEISKNEIDNFDVKSNTTIIGENSSSIDVEKIKKILDTKYKETSQRKSLRLEDTENDIEEELENTKEYDLNIILEKAKEKKPDNYGEDRHKKLNDTNFNILQKLNLEEKPKEKPEENIEEDKLNEMSNNFIEEEKDSNSSLDILSDLKGNSNTEILEGLKDDIDLQEEKKEKELDKSFYTSSNKIQDKDYEDIEDFAKDVESNNIALKIIIALILVILVIGVYLLIKTMFFS